MTCETRFNPNIELFDKIKTQLKRHPSRFVMASWFSSRDEKDMNNDYQLKPCAVNRLLKEGFCKTTACLAGHAIVMASDDPYKFIDTGFEATVTEGARLLNITFEQGRALFLVTEWPDTIKEEIRKLAGYTNEHVSDQFEELSPRVRARLAIKRIDMFLESKGEL